MHENAHYVLQSNITNFLLSTGEYYVYIYQQITRATEEDLLCTCTQEGVVYRKEKSCSLEDNMDAKRKRDAHALEKLVSCFKQASLTYTNMGKIAQAYIQSGDMQNALKTLRQRTEHVAHFFDLDVLALVLHLDEEVARILCEEMSVHSSRAFEALKHNDIDEHAFLMQTNAACGSNRLEILSRQLEMFIPAA